MKNTYTSLRAKRSNLRDCFIAILLAMTTIVQPVHIFAEEKVSQTPAISDFKTIDVEIMEVEELKEPAGSAIYTAKDLISGRTLRFFVDPYVSLIQSGGQSVSAGDVTGGSKATIIYRESSERNMSEVVFAQVSGSYY